MPALNLPQARFIQLPQKYRAFVSGFGGGKTWVGCSAMCARYWSYPKQNQAYYAPTYPHIRDIFFPTIEEVAYGLGLRAECKDGNKEVHFYSGSKYRGTTICRSMEIPASIIGYKVGNALVDEFDLLPVPKAMQAWRKILGRLRWPDARNGADVTTTPEGFKATHKIFVSDIAEKPELSQNYGLVQASSRSNAKNLPDGYIDSLFEAYPDALRDAYIDGRFCNLTTGTVYGRYDRVLNGSTETVRNNETLFIGMDFNISKMAATVYVQRENGWHAVSEFHSIFDTPAMVERIKERFPNRRIVVYPDATGQNPRSTNDASKSDVAILRGAGFEIRAHTINPRVRDRVLAVNKQFEAKRLWVNAKTCPTVASCLEKQAYDEGGDPDKKNGFDHQNDATGYPIAYEFPIIRPMRQVQVVGL